MIRSLLTGCVLYQDVIRAPGPKVPVSFVAGDESCWRFVRRDRSDVARIFTNDDYRIALIIRCRYGDR